MDDKTIVILLFVLAVLSYYANPFGWTPNERHGGASKEGTLMALLLLVAGIGWAHHSGLFPEQSMLSEYAGSSFDRTTERFHAYLPNFSAGLGAWDGNLLSAETAAELRDTLERFAVRLGESAQSAAHSIGQLAANAQGASPTQPNPKS